MAQEVAIYAPASDWTGRGKTGSSTQLIVPPTKSKGIKSARQDEKKGMRKTRVCTLQTSRPDPLVLVAKIEKSVALCCTLVVCASGLTARAVNQGY